jgi:hypothetical protein
MTEGEEGTMRRLSFLVSALAPAAILHLARIGGLVLLFMLVLGSPSASALPIASGSKCKSNWVNNEGAMACFVQGEEDVRNGVAHPHYVACSDAGEIFCCVDDAKGQNCEAVRAGGRPPNENVKLGAILDAQETILTVLGQISDKVDKLESKLGNANGK